MSGSAVKFSVFTKAWRDMPLAQLGEYVRSLGFDGIELPVRAGFQVEPGNVERDLPAAAKTLAEEGVSIFSVADGTDERTFAACAAAGVPVVRICPVLEGPFTESMDAWRRKLDDLTPLLEEHGVTLGLQNHCDPRFVPHAMALKYLLDGRDRRHVAAVWDAAHNALEGEVPEYAIDVIWPHLCMVNLKNAVRARRDAPGTGSPACAEWKVVWTAGREGFASWPRVAQELVRRGYDGVVCLTAEYSDEAAVDRLIAEDIEFARALF